jgi:hypothetical protein
LFGDKGMDYFVNIVDVISLSFEAAISWMAIFIERYNGVFIR